MKTLESKFEIGELVEVALTGQSPIYAFVRAITFTSSKVRYALWVREAETTLHNVDSAFVKAVEPQLVTEMPEDNYS